MIYVSFHFTKAPCLVSIPPNNKTRPTTGPQREEQVEKKIGIVDAYYSHDGNVDWQLPERWLPAPDGLDLATPLNFASTADTYGGNSGSPSVWKSTAYSSGRTKNGHEEGSFTGADQSRPGRFELAESGSIYLDDVDDIPLEHQAKLLRAIEEKVFERVGGTKTVKVNVRMLAATHQKKIDVLRRVMRHRT